jgi:hypothetical protein
MRFASESDQYKLSAKIGRCQAVISSVVNELSIWLDRCWGWLLDCDHQGVMHPERLADYADAIHQFGAPFRTVIGSHDAMIRRCCRPGQFQRCAYNGYYHQHAGKFQAVGAPNGLFIHLFGPAECRGAT